MALTVRLRSLDLALRDPFRIARSGPGDGQRVTTVVAELLDDRFPDLVGLGEGFPSRYYGETPATMAAVVPLLLEVVGELEPTLEGLDAAASAMGRAIRGNGAAKCALDIALHDLAGKVHGLTGQQLRGLSPDIPPADFTLGIDAPDVVAARARRVGDFPALKVKCGGLEDLATVRAVRASYDGPIRVDANAGWTRESAAELISELVDLGVELIEQPFAPRAYRDLAWLQERVAIPVVVDESSVTVEDLDALAGIVAGVNIKLAKVGGIGPAHRMLEEARRRGFRTFVGCMQETSIGIAASVVVASLAEWVDLDGSLLLAEDPFTGLTLRSDKRWQSSGRPGLGIAAVGTG